MLTRLFRWAIYLFILLLIVAVAAVLLLNTMVKQLLESRLRLNTGMDVRIEKVDIGLLSPTITLDNCKIYNSADFGGSLFLDMPELRVEYDPNGLRNNTLHFKLVRLNLAELNLLRDKKGRSNAQALDKKSRASSNASGGIRSPMGDLKFTGIDSLNLTLGKVRILNLASGANQEIDFGIRDQIYHNVKTAADLGPINLLAATRSPTSTNPPFDLAALLNNLLAP